MSAWGMLPIGNRFSAAPNVSAIADILPTAESTKRTIGSLPATTRYLLLDMRDRKGWKALGYESFGDYGKKSLGYEKAYLTQLADAGEISLQLGYDAEFAIANYPPPESQLRPLKSVPESVRKEIWDEARACEAVDSADPGG